MKNSLGYRLTNWKSIELRKRAEAEVEAIVEKAWEEIVDAARLKAVEGRAEQLRAAWPRAGK